MKKRLMAFVNLLINSFYGRNIKIITTGGTYFLKTTFGHPLKRYLINFEKYDRFVPYLSKVISKSVIDIGANIGDTLVLIKSVSNAEVICVEPDENFRRYLKQNIKLNHLKAVKLYPFPVSSTEKVVTIEKNGLKSTSNISVSSNNGSQTLLLTKTFKDLVNDLSLDINSIGIIKSDTDGYDWDCLNSIADYFDSSANFHYPEFIFYEHQTYLNNSGTNDPSRKEREKKYEDSLRRLVQHGYTEFYIFDNFGSLIHQTKNINELLNIVNEGAKGKSLTKFSNYFFDVLITQAATDHIVERALSLQTAGDMTVN
jgi:FkbM family methyltransferase